MRRGLNQFSGTCDILLSGNDLTADEFKFLNKTNKHWRGVMAQATILLLYTSYAADEE